MDIPILSLNLFMRPPLIQNGLFRTDHKDLRLRLFLERHLPQYEVLCLQELFRTANGRPGRLLSEFARVHGSCHSHHLPSLWRRGRPIDSGLYIVSKWPIVERDQWVYSDARGPDALTAKGVLSALLRVQRSSGDKGGDYDGGAYVAVFCTHLQADYRQHEQRDDGEWNLYMKTQMRQLRELRRFVLQKMGHYRKRYGLKLHNAAFLAGDVNVNARNVQDFHKDSMLYREMMSVLNGKAASSAVSNELQIRFVDLLKETTGRHPVTFGAVEYDEVTKKILPKETVLTGKSEQMCQSRLDYIFQILAKHDDDDDDDEGEESEESVGNVVGKGEEEEGVKAKEEDLAPSCSPQDSVGEWNVSNEMCVADVVTIIDEKQIRTTRSNDDAVVIRCSTHSTRVQEFFVTSQSSLTPLLRQQQKGSKSEKPLTVTQLSDHYGVSTFLKLESLSHQIDHDNIDLQARHMMEIIRGASAISGAKTLIRYLSPIVILVLLLFFVCAIMVAVVILANTQ